MFRPSRPYGTSEAELSALYQTAKGGSETSQKGLALLGALGILVFVVALTSTEKAR